MTETTFTNEMQIRDSISDLVCLIDVAELPENEKIDAIDYAIKMLNELKEQIS